LLILNPDMKQALHVRTDLSGIYRAWVHAHQIATVYDPNLSNNTARSWGAVAVTNTGHESLRRARNDYDGDGKADFALWQAENYLWAICLSGPQYQSIIKQRYAVGSWPVPGDYDGDGITDVAIYCQLNSWWNALFSSTEQSQAVPFFGGAEFAAAQGDFDGDSMTDPTVYRSSDGTWLVAASSQGYAICQASLGRAGGQPVAADYDGDGLADPAVYNRATGLWNIAFSGIGYQVSTWTFGGPDYLPASADYDGDGLVDPAVYAPGKAYLQVLLSGSLATKGVHTWQGGVIGSINGTPAPADYDGDGIDDFAVYHTATGLWELFPSAHGYQEQIGYLGDPTYQPVTELTAISGSNSRIF
jgi:hypothetical protein